jgi:hypothetical protein
VQVEYDITREDLVALDRALGRPDGRKAIWRVYLVGFVPAVLLLGVLAAMLVGGNAPASAYALLVPPAVASALLVMAFGPTARPRSCRGVPSAWETPADARRHGCTRRSAPGADRSLLVIVDPVIETPSHVFRWDDGITSFPALHSVDKAALAADAKSGQSQGMSGGPTSGCS